MARTHTESVGGQFGPQAKAYVESAVHAAGGDLDRLEEIVRAARPSHALDLGTGGGHVAYRLAPHAARVTAVDLLPDMLAAVAEAARGRGIANLDTVQSPAERLAIADGTFDFLACRYSAHHWRDFEGGIREARRVLRRGATAVFMDAVSPGPALLDTHLQAVELLRDTSHARDYTAAEWHGALTRSGFLVEESRTWRVRMDFPVWIARMRTPDTNVAAIRALQAVAPAEVAAHFGIEADGSFHLDVLLTRSVAA